MVAERIVPLIGPEPPSWFSDNGCSWVPDKWHDVNWAMACRYHDFAYSGLAKISRLTADSYLMINMIRCGAPWRVAVMYFLGVRWFGRHHYTKAK